MSLPRQHAPLATSSEILAGIAAIRRRRRVSIIFFLAFLPAVVIFAYLVEFEQATSIFGALWMAITVTAYLRTTLSRCPQCGLLFHTGVISYDLWTRRCVHCGLEF